MRVEMSYVQGISLQNGRYAGVSSPDTKRYTVIRGIFSGIRSVETNPLEAVD